MLPVTHADHRIVYEHKKALALQNEGRASDKETT